MAEADGYVRIKADLDDAALTKKMSSLANQINRQTEALAKAKANAAALERELAKIMNGDIKPKSVQAMEQELARTEKQLEQLGSKYYELAQARQSLKEGNINGVNDAQIAEITEQLEELSARMVPGEMRVDELRAKLEQLKLNPETTEEAKELATQIGLANSHVERLDADLSNSKEAMAALENETEKTGEATKKTSEKAKGLGLSIGKIVKGVFLLAAARKIFNALKNSMMAMSGLGVIGNVFSDFNQKMQEAYLKNTEVRNALASLKGSLYTAFEPIYSAVAPALATLIGWLSRGIQYIAAFFSALSGKSLGDSAKGANKLAKAVGGVGGAAKQANKQLASFDKLNTLSEDSGGGGGGGGGAGDIMPDFSSMADDGKLAAIAAFAEKIKAIFRGLWNFIKTNFDFAGFWENIKQIFRGVIDFLAGVFTGDWDRAFGGIVSIVEGWGGAVSKILDFIEAILLNALDWAHGIIVSFFNWLSQKTGYDFSTILRTIQDVFTTVKTFISGVISNIKLVIKGIVDFVAGVFSGDWRRAWEGLTEIVRGVFGGVATTVVTIINGLITALNAFLGLAENVINKLGGNVNLHIGLLNVPQFASGGFPDAGSLFIAGEAGPELVGSFGGNNNSVINEAQLVQAFRQASSEQVALMQQQNNLLAALLNKELTFKPSSAAGKAFSQSIGMYNRAMGV